MQVESWRAVGDRESINSSCRRSKKQSYLNLLLNSCRMLPPSFQLLVLLLHLHPSLCHADGWRLKVVTDAFLHTVCCCVRWRRPRCSRACLGPRLEPGCDASSRPSMTARAKGPSSSHNQAVPSLPQLGLQLVAGIFGGERLIRCQLQDVWYSNRTF